MGDLLDRTDWLKHHGFRDPFPESSLRGNEDPLLNTVFKDGQIIGRFNTDVFIQPSNFDISSAVNLTGPRFIFAPVGGGKSSLCRYIKYRLDESVANSPLVPEGKEPKGILAIEYRPRFHKGRKVMSYIEDIVDLIKSEAANIGVIPRPQNLDINIKQREENILRDIVLRCQEHNLHGVCILVDEIDKDKLESALDFLRSSDLFSFPGMMIKFFLPEEILDVVRNSLHLNNKYAYSTIHWNKEDLAELLRQRLRNSRTDSGGNLRDDYNLEEYEYFKSLFSDETKANWNGVPDEFITVALAASSPTPRLMWRLGYHLIKEHFDIAGGYCHSGRLIELSTFTIVKNKMLDEIKKLENKSKIKRSRNMEKGKKNIVNVSGGSPQINIGENVSASQINNMLPDGFLDALVSAKKQIAENAAVPQAQKDICVHKIEEIEKEAALRKPTNKVKNLADGLLSILKSIPELLKVVAMLEPLFTKLG